MMSTTTRNITFTGAITAIAGTILWQVHGLLSAEAFAWTLVYIGMSFLALTLSWAVTNAWKFDQWKESEWKALTVRRAIRRFARWSCAVAQLLLDVVIVLLAWPAMSLWPPRVWIAAIILAGMLLLTLSFWSPDLWKWVFRVLLKRINRDMLGRGSDPAKGVMAPPDFAPGDNDELDPTDPKPPGGFR